MAKTTPVEKRAAGRTTDTGPAGRPARRLLLFGVTRLADMLEKGNVWYVRHYETYFDEVYVAYLTGYHPNVETQGKTRLISLGGTSDQYLLDLLLAPWRLYRLANRIRPTSYLTADIFFGWWTGLLVRRLKGARMVLMPVCIPEEIYSLGHTVTGLPIPVERLLLRLSYASAATIIMGRNSDTSLAWLRGDRQTARKLAVVPATVEEFPPPAFFRQIEQCRPNKKGLSEPPVLLYVGRLHHEKLTSGLVDMMARLRAIGVNARLLIAGDGPERSEMERRATQMNIAEEIEWLGFVPAEELVAHYRRADVFVSTVTGTSLREAGLCGLPVVGYNADWVRGLLRHEETALLVPSGDYAALAEQIARILRDDRLRQRIARAFHDIATARWTPDLIYEALAESFGPDDRR